MVMRVKTDMLVCESCIHFTANGEVFVSHEDITIEHGERMIAHVGEDLRHMVLGGDHRGFFGEGSTCDGCGTDEAGDRYTAHILEPVPGK